MHPIRLVSTVQSMAGACCECLCVCVCVEWIFTLQPHEGCTCDKGAEMYVRLILASFLLLFFQMYTYLSSRKKTRTHTTTIERVNEWTDQLWLLNQSELDEMRNNVINFKYLIERRAIVFSLVYVSGAAVLRHFHHCVRPFAICELFELHAIFSYLITNHHFCHERLIHLGNRCYQVHVKVSV